METRAPHRSFISSTARLAHRARHRPPVLAERSNGRSFSHRTTRWSDSGNPRNARPPSLTLTTPFVVGHGACRYQPAEPIILGSRTPHCRLRIYRPTISSLRAVRLPKVLLSCLSLLVASCTATTSTPSTTTTSVASTTTTSVTGASTPPSMSSEAEAYLNEALALMEAHSINSADVDWSAVQERAFRLAATAQEPRHTHPAIVAALAMLDDDHSIFLSPVEAESFTAGEALFTEPEVMLMGDRIGYVAVGRYLGDTGDQADAYAADLAMAIDSIAGQACGWIVDLTANTGGNMWPMLGGLSPLLGPGVVGYFTYPDGRTETWEIGRGAVSWKGEEMVRNGHQPDPETTQMPVAVLVSSLTASSGEATATAFRGRPNTRLFGQTTAGLTTANELVVLSDGAMIALTMSVFTDRNGHQFGQDVPIEPDEILEATDDPLAVAVSWLDSAPRLLNAVETWISLDHVSLREAPNTHDLGLVRGRRLIPLPIYPSRLHAATWPPSLSVQDTNSFSSWATTEGDVGLRLTDSSTSSLGSVNV